MSRANQPNVKGGVGDARVEQVFGYNDHNPPHFHAEYNGEEACFEIATLKRIDGALPPRICGYVVEWALLHQSELQNNWHSLQMDGTFEKIMPLV